MSSNIETTRRVWIETTRKIWIGEGFLLLRPWQEGDDCIELCTVEGEDSEQFFGKVSILFGDRQSLRDLAKALLLTADEMEEQASADNPNKQPDKQEEWVPPEACNERLKLFGKPYYRTCKICGLTKQWEQCKAYFARLRHEAEVE